mgnify:CR=1 FL=1
MAIDLNDKTANGNNLTNNGAAEVAGLFSPSSTAVDLESTETDYLYAADSTSLSITGDLSIESYVNFESTPASGARMAMVCKYRDDTANRSYWFGLFNNGGTLQLEFIISNDGTATESAAVNWTPTAGTSYHVAVTLTAATRIVKFYVDGTQQGADQTLASFTSIFDSTTRLSIGAQTTEGTPANLLDGKADEVRIWNDVRTAGEISGNKDSELNGSEANLVAYWPFESDLGANKSYGFFM